MINQYFQNYSMDDVYIIFEKLWWVHMDSICISAFFPSTYTLNIINYKLLRIMYFLIYIGIVYYIKNWNGGRIATMYTHTHMRAHVHTHTHSLGKQYFRTVTCLTYAKLIIAYSFIIELPSKLFICCKDGVSSPTKLNI